MNNSSVTIANAELKKNALAEKLGALLLDKQLTISCAESCTGGGIAYAITSVAGSSAWFNQSWVTYSNDAKQKLIGVSTVTLTSHGAVSQQTAREMVDGVVANSGADVGVSVTGIAGPSGGSADKPVGLVWFGFKFGSESIQVAQEFLGDRTEVRNRAIIFALEFLIERLVD